MAEIGYVSHLRIRKYDTIRCRVVMKNYLKYIHRKWIKMDLDFEQIRFNVELNGFDVEPIQFIL